MILAIIQARMSSSRLPGKVLKPILGKPMLQLLLERVQLVKNIDQITVVTSINEEDEAIVELCQSLNVPCFQGSSDDVLDRHYQAALLYQPEYVVRITGDCPLLDPKLIEKVVDFTVQGNYDYASNVQKITFPDGLDVEVFRFSTLEQAWKEAKLPSHREHVTFYITQNPEIFKLGSFVGSEDLSELRWTVDEPADLELVRHIYKALYPNNTQFITEDILSLLEQQPELKTLNTKHKRNAGWQKAFDVDEKWVNQNLLNSLAMQNRAKQRIPGMTMLLSKRPDQFSMGVWPGYYSKAQGVDVWDLDGNHYIDMSIGGIGATVLGYADPDVNAAVEEAVAKGSSCSLNCSEEVELAELLCQIHPWAQKVRFARTGGESMAIAVRIARAFTGCDKIAFCGYHGWHDWYLSANLGTKNALAEHLLSGLEPCGVPKGLEGTTLPFAYNQLKELEQIINNHKNELAAIVMEPIRNEQPQDGFLEGVRALADQVGAVLIVDEISAGFRMNTGGAHQVLGLTPDIAVFSKALGNGFPIAAIIGKAKIMEAAQKTFISSTYWTERIGPAAALATIHKHKKLDVGKHLMNIGQQIQEGWKKSAEKHGLLLEVYGIAPLSHFDFKDARSSELKALFVQLMLDKGFLASTRFYAMYAHRQEHVEQYLEAVNKTFADISEICQQDNLAKKLRGQPAVAGFERLI